MSNGVQLFIEFLETDIKNWEDAAEYCEKHVDSVEGLGASNFRTGKQEAEKYRARIAEFRKLLEQLKKEQ
jgi:hypothetical protein